MEALELQIMDYHLKNEGKLDETNKLGSDLSHVEPLVS
jgi:hypothetical protein